MLNDILVKKGYSLSDIKNMDIDEYDFIVNLNIEEKKFNPFEGGI